MEGKVSQKGSSFRKEEVSMMKCTCSDKEGKGK